MAYTSDSAKQYNIERAMGTARLIGGQVSALKRGPRGSWTLVVDQTNSRYNISLWDDDKPQHQAALEYSVGDIVTLQVHAYTNPAYEDWKIWDVLEFTRQDQQLVTQLNDGIKANFLASRQSFQQGQQELRQIGELQEALRLQEAERDSQNAWRALAGIGSAVGCIVAAPFTGGMSLFGLGGSAVMLSTNTTSTAFANTQLRHRLENVSRIWEAAYQQASKALQCANTMDRVLEGAKLQPWKATAHHASYGLVPQELRDGLQAIVSRGRTITVDARTVNDYRLGGF